jgi:hypothetical protein
VDRAGAAGGGTRTSARVLGARALGNHLLRWPASRSRDLRPWWRGGLGLSVDLEKGVDDMTLPKVLHSPERDVLLVSALIAIVMVLAFTDWGVLAYVVTGLVFAVLLLASAIANRRATHR